MENEEDWLVGLGAFFFTNILLMLVEKLWVKFDVSWLVDTVDVAETRSN